MNNDCPNEEAKFLITAYIAVMVWTLIVASLGWYALKILEVI